MSEEDPPAKRMRLGDDGMSKEELIAEHKKQESYITTLLSKLDGSTCGIGAQSDLEERLKQQHAEASRKEKVLLMQLTRKEQELQEIATQLGDVTKGNTPGASQLRSALLDPTLNIMFQRMRNQLDEKSKKLQQATDDMAAWKFTPDSQTGKRLMSKCRTLIQENQELGKQVSTGRTAQLEAELALQKKYSEELKASQDELNEFVIQLDEEVEGMQSTICALQQQLKEAKDELAATKAKQTELRAPEQLAPQQQVHKQVAQQEPEPEERTSTVQQIEAPESPMSETGPAPTPCSPSPAPKSPPHGVAAGNRTPSEEVSFAASAEGEGTKGTNRHPWTADESETYPLAEEGSPGGEDRTADGTTMSCREEEKERTTTEKQEEKERTTKMSKDQVRTFSYEEMETQEQCQHGEEVEEKMTNKVMIEDLKDSLHEECREPEWCQQWDQEQQHQQQQRQQHQQQQEKAEEEMEIDSSRFENDSSSTESEGFPIDTQQSKSAGELTSPVASCEVSKTLAGDDSDEGFNTMTPEQGSTEPSTLYQGLDPTQDDTHESSSETKSSVEPSGSSDLGVVDSSSSGQGTEGSSTETREVQDTSTDNQDNALTSSQIEGVSNSTFQNKVTLGKAVSVSPVLNKSAQMAQFSEVKVTTKKPAHNCSLSVVDYDTGSSDEDDYTGDEDDGGFVEEPPRPANKQLPSTINHSPTNHSPESPHQNLSPDNSSPTSPANNTGNMGNDVSPLKNLAVQMLPGNGVSDAGLLTKPNEPRDLGYIEENGTGLVHDNEQVTAATD